MVPAGGGTETPSLLLDPGAGNSHTRDRSAHICLNSWPMRDCLVDFSLGVGKGWSESKALCVGFRGWPWELPLLTACPLWSSCVRGGCPGGCGQWGQAGRGSDEMDLHPLGLFLQLDEYDQPIAIFRNMSSAQACLSGQFYSVVLSDCPFYKLVTSLPRAV